MWETIEGSLYRKFVFKDFTTAFAFMVQVAFLAEQQQHHPRMSNVYNKVEIWLTTHDAGNQITEKDHRLAAAIDQIG